MKPYGNYFSGIGQTILQSNACSHAKGSDTLPRPRDGNANDYFVNSFSKYSAEAILQHCKNISGNTEVVLKKSKAISMAQNEILKLKKLMLLNGQQQGKDPSLKNAVQNRIKLKLQEKTVELQRDMELRKKSVDKFNQSIGVAHQHANQLLSGQQNGVSRLIAKIDGQINHINEPILNWNPEKKSGTIQKPVLMPSTAAVASEQSRKAAPSRDKWEKKQIYREAVSSEFTADRFQPQRVLNIEEKYTKCETKVKGLKDLIEELTGKIKSSNDEKIQKKLQEILDDAKKTHIEEVNRLDDLELELFLKTENASK